METLILDRRPSGVATLTLNRPHKKNAINSVMWTELLEVFSTFGKGDNERVLVMTGAEGDFCSGADLAEGRDRAAEDPPPPRRHQLDRMHDVSKVILALHQISVPVIAKVDGVAVGGGCNLALGCDLIVASQRARFSEIFARRGLSLDCGGSWLLPRLVGMHKAKELALLAEVISADEAERIGIVNRVVPLEELDAFVDEWATRLAEGAPLALKMSKRMLTDAFSYSLNEALDAEAMAQTVNFGADDASEAINAFLEKRQPIFQGS
ncbi:MAG: enoyl-CoA hydratase-related protein [Acidobacteriota bacterium]|nr:enoyl-CoA hydratase-related protein [Acidobacteriota bacterium]